MVPEPDTSSPTRGRRCSDAYLRMLCEHTGVAVVATDAEGRIQFWNRAAARMFGAVAEQMLGAAFFSVIPQENRASAEQMLRRAVSEGKIDSFEFCARDPQGQRRHLTATVSPVVEETGRIIGTSVCTRDITQRILLQEQLARQRKMGALGAMAGALAHDFSNILGGITTGVDFALASNDPGMQRRVLEKTAKALARASELGAALRTFAEGDFRTEDLADLTEIFLEVAHSLEGKWVGGNITLEVRSQPIPVTAVPRAQMQTVLHHVLHNAREAMPEGGRLTLELGPVEGGYAIRVTDTGCGVSEERLDHLFEPFYSTKNDRDQNDGVPRAGLGLAVAHGILQVLGGRISVQSKVGEGSTFEIFLPRTPPKP